MLARNYRLANWLGFLSIFLTAIPAVFILMPTGSAQNNLTGYIVIWGGGAASLLLSVGAGLLGSRLWFLALLGPAIVMALVLFSP